MFLPILAGILLLSTTADAAFFWEAKDGNYNNYETSKGASSGGDSDVTVNLSTGVIDAYANTLVYGDSWAEASIWAEFTYTGNGFGPCVIQAGWYQEGELEYSGDAGASFETSFIIKNITTSEVVHTDFSKQEQSSDLGTYSSWSTGKNATSDYTSYLQPGHDYRVTLLVKVSSEAASGTSDADFWDDTKRINVEYFRVEEGVYTRVTDGGNKNGTEIQIDKILTQDEFDNANALRFSRSQPYRVKGWEVTFVSPFSSADSARDPDEEDFKINAEAWDGTVPQGRKVWFASSHWSCGNDAGSYDVEWQEESKGAAGRAWSKAMPDYIWKIGPATPITTIPGAFQHLFQIVNLDPTAQLRVTGLQFLISPGYIDEPTGIQFSGDVYNELLLDPGDAHSVGLITFGNWYGSYIYFKYILSNLDGTKDVCSAWGGHEVVQVVDDTREYLPTK